MGRSKKVVTSKKKKFGKSGEGVSHGDIWMGIPNLPRVLEGTSAHKVRFLSSR
jgi:hypothetical protein